MPSVYTSSEYRPYDYRSRTNCSADGARPVQCAAEAEAESGYGEKWPYDHADPYADHMGAAMAMQPHTLTNGNEVRGRAMTALLGVPSSALGCVRTV